MPAIQPARLRQQVALLAQHFGNPPAFVRSLHHLLDFYAERTHRPGQSGKPAPLLLAYKVHSPILREILLEIAPLAEQDPAGALVLCDALWEQSYLEFRQLASMLLGEIPVQDPEPLLRRLRTWLKPDLEEHLVAALLTSGLARLRKENPQAVTQIIQDWLDQPKFFQQHLGLVALLPLAQDPGFENLPVFFRLIHPLVRQAPPALRPDLLDMLAALAHRSGQETAYFLRQTLALPNCPDTPWIIRQLLPEFPPDQQKRLRNALRGAELASGLESPADKEHPADKGGQRTSEHPADKEPLVPRGRHPAG